MTVPLTARDVASSLMARHGTAWSREIAQACIEAYVPLHTTTLEPDVAVTLDLAYGPHPRQRLDVYGPKALGPHPVVIFFHGGGLNGGDKNLPGTGERIYANVGRFYARHGVVALIANYRLVPDAAYPDGGDDVALSVAWAHEHLPGWGGDLGQLTLLGNSAGAVHVVTYLLTRWKPGDISQAIVLTTPFTMPEGEPRGLVTTGYYGPDARARAADGSGDTRHATHFAHASSP